ncbi:hypothetical protein G7Y79_00030g064220 [Physcia stellaris]|nr:hypothetical protein G7Y79_00030g064220 [Physcia stellaris]
MDNVEEEGDRQCQVSMVLADTQREMIHWTIYIAMKVSMVLVSPMKRITTPMARSLMMMFTSEGEDTPLGEVNMILGYTDPGMTHWTIHIGVVSILLSPLIKMITTLAAHSLMMNLTSEGEDTPLDLATQLSTPEPSEEPILDRISVTLKTQIHLRETHSLTEDATSINPSILVPCQMIMSMQEPTEAVNLTAAEVAAATNTHSLHHGGPARIQRIASIWTVNAVTITEEVDIVECIKVIPVRTELVGELASGSNVGSDGYGSSRLNVSANAEMTK